MKALSLFSGIGGLDLAAEMAGIKVVAFCEIEPYPISILEKRYPGIPIYNDIRQLKGSDFNDRIDVIHGGFPCQDLSQAGKRAGLEGERSGLWFEMLRIISEVRPRYVLAENVRGAINLALDTVYSGLVGEGYKVYPYVIPASAVGAPHKRERLFVVGIREDVQRRYTEAIENPGCELRQGGGEYGEVEGKTREGTTRDAQFSGGTLWPTPRAQEPGKTTEGYGRGLQELVEGKEQRKLWPTPTQRDYKGASAEEGLIRNDGKSRMDQLPNAVKFWPTPREFMYKDSIVDRNKGNIGEKVGGQLNPDWVEQLMGYPEGWTDLDVDEPREWAGWPALLGQEQYPYEFPRTTTGCKNRAKRLKALGNSVVPAQAYPFFKAIVAMENSITEGMANGRYSKN